MKLYLIGHDYRYAVEQMMLTLFPEERPEYVSAPPEKGDSWAKLSLRRGAVWATVSAELCAGAAVERALCRAKISSAEDGQTVQRSLQHLVKLAFYRAAVGLRGSEPPWGALSGVRPVKLLTRALEEGATPDQVRHMMKQKYRVSPSRVELAMDCAAATERVKRTLKPEEVSLYVGIPFCPTRCAYCSFVSAAVPGALKLTEPYLEALTGEMEAAAGAVKQAGLSIKSVYIGGGTPTTLSAEQLDALMKKLRESFDLSGCAEFTVEAGRPDTITVEKLAALLHNGANRLSVNPQSMSDAVLRAMGRAHTAQESLEAYRLVRQAGAPCVNMDLIAGLPEDSMEGFRRSLDTVLSLRPENITVHTLALKKGSRLMEEKSRLPDGEAVAAMLDYAQDTLRQAGYKPYYLYRQKFMSGSFENVGWSLPGFENIYNICMMEELHTVLALGAGGVTKLVDRETGRIERIANPKYPNEYLRDGERIAAAKNRIVTVQEVRHGLSASGN